MNIRTLVTRVSLLFCAAALVPYAIAAPTAPAKAPTADDIVTRHVAACGGLKAIRSISTLVETGRVIAGPNREARVVRSRKRPDHTRFEFTLQGVTGVFVSDGRRGWKMNPLDGDTGQVPLPDVVIHEAAEQGDIEGPLVDYKAKGHKVELVGRETVDGHDTYKLKVTLKSGGVRTEYLDVKTLYRVRSESTRQMKGRPVQITTTFADYRKTGGVPFPRRIEVAASGRPQTLRVEVDDVQVNPPLDDALFVTAIATAAAPAP